MIRVVAARSRLTTLAVVLLVTAGLLSLAVVSDPNGRVCRVVIAARNSLTADEIRQLEAEDPRLANCRWFVPARIGPRRDR
jgi:hypothetical protein